MSFQRRSNKNQNEVPQKVFESEAYRTILSLGWSPVPKSDKTRMQRGSMRFKKNGTSIGDDGYIEYRITANERPYVYRCDKWDYDEDGVLRPRMTKQDRIGWDDDPDFRLKRAEDWITFLEGIVLDIKENFEDAREPSLTSE